MDVAALVVAIVAALFSGWAVLEAWKSRKAAQTSAAAAQEQARSQAEQVVEARRARAAEHGADFDTALALERRGGDGFNVNTRNLGPGTADIGRAVLQLADGTTREPESISSSHILQGEELRLRFAAPHPPTGEVVTLLIAYQDRGHEGEQEFRASIAWHL